MPSQRKKTLLQGLRRKAGSRRPRARFVLFSEGENTEPDYFRSLGRMVRDALVVLELVGGAGEPRAIARAAVERKRQNARQPKDSFERFDEIWAVFDRDEHPNFDEAITLCAAEGISVAKSNSCFELWLILHLEDYDRACDRHDVQRYLGKIHSPYKASKRKLADAEQLLKFLTEAEIRSEKQCNRREQERSANGPPSTTVHLLTRSIFTAAGYSKKKKEEVRRRSRRHGKS